MINKRCGIYSFPKSGNTWMREIIRGVFDQTGDTNDIVPDVYQKGIDGKVMENSKGEQWVFYKSHSQKELTRYQGDAVKNDLIIYITRNPFDVFCSQLNYLLRGFDPGKGGIQLASESIDEAKESGLVSDYFSSFLVFGTLMPFFKDAGSWMSNVEYWTQKAQKNDNIIVVKYEDMVGDIEKAMKPVLQALGMPNSCLEKAINTAQSRTNDGGKFFWKKQVGTFREYLDAPQVDKFQSSYPQVMSGARYNHISIESN